MDKEKGEIHCRVQGEGRREGEKDNCDGRGNEKRG
jgi:hypothetical protein